MAIDGGIKKILPWTYFLQSKMNQGLQNRKNLSFLISTNNMLMINKKEDSASIPG